jgi:hypothetical protein
MLTEEECQTNRFANLNNASLYSSSTSLTAYHSSSRALPDALDLTVAPLDWRSDSYILLDEEGGDLLHAAPKKGWMAIPVDVIDRRRLSASLIAPDRAESFSCSRFTGTALVMIAGLEGRFKCLREYCLEIVYSFVIPRSPTLRDRLCCTFLTSGLLDP